MPSPVPRSRPPQGPVPGRFSRSLAASLALHGTAYGLLVASVLALTAVEGHTRRAPVVFAAPEPPRPPSEPPPEPERDVEVPEVEGSADVRELEVAVAPPPEPRFAPVDLDPSPLARARLDALRRRPRHERAQEPPPAESAAGPVAEPAAETPAETVLRLVTPTLEAAPETPPEPVGIEVRDRAPRPIPELCRSPLYPRRAVQRGWEGTVVCLITVGSDGSVLEVQIAESSGYGLLDRVASSCVAGWRFEPGTRGGRPVRMDVLKPVLFRVL